MERIERSWPWVKLASEGVDRERVDDVRCDLVLEFAFASGSCSIGVVEALDALVAAGEVADQVGEDKGADDLTLGEPALALALVGLGLGLALALALAMVAATRALAGGARRTVEAIKPETAATEDSLVVGCTGAGRGTRREGSMVPGPSHWSGEAIATKAVAPGTGYKRRDGKAETSRNQRGFVLWWGERQRKWTKANGGPTKAERRLGRRRRWRCTWWSLSP